jgi:hypothetical protein
VAGERVTVDREALEAVAVVLDEAHAYHVARAEAKRAEAMRADAELPSLAVELGIQRDVVSRLLAGVQADLDGPAVFGKTLLGAAFVGQLLEHKGWDRVRLYCGSTGVRMQAERIADDVSGPLAGRVEVAQRSPAQDGIRTILGDDQWLAVKA